VQCADRRRIEGDIPLDLPVERGLDKVDSCENTVWDNTSVVSGFYSKSAFVVE